MTTLFTIPCWEICDTILLIISFFLAITPYFVIYSLKPKLKIVSASICKDFNSKKVIKIAIENRGWWADANNVRIESCAINLNSNLTYHLKLDLEDFLVIPTKSKCRDNIRVFKVINISESAKQYINNLDDVIKLLKRGQCRLRVRVHSYHSFSGLGKAEEKVIDFK